MHISLFLINLKAVVYFAEHRAPGPVELMNFVSFAPIEVAFCSSDGQSAFQNRPQLLREQTGSIVCRCYEGRIKKFLPALPYPLLKPTFEGRTGKHFTDCY